MKINITKIKKLEEAQAAVQFDSSWGSAPATWMGEAPEVGNEYDVEIEVPSALNWGEDIYESLKSGVGIFESDGRACLTCHLDSIDENEVATILFGDDVLLIEVKGMPTPHPALVLLKPAILHLFNINL